MIVSHNPLASLRFAPKQADSARGHPNGGGAMNRHRRRVTGLRGVLGEPTRNRRASASGALELSALCPAPPRFLSLRRRVAQHVQDMTMQVPHRALEIEISQDDRSHHAAVEMGRYKLREACGIDGFEQSLLHPVTDDLGEEPAFLDVKSLDRLGDGRVALMGTPEIERDFNKAMYFVVLVDVVGKPGGQDGGGVGALVLQGADVLEGADYGALDRRPKQVRLAVEIVIDQGRIDIERLGNVLDRDRGKVPFGKQLERGGEKAVAAAGTWPKVRETSLAGALPRAACARKLPDWLLRHLATSGSLPQAPRRCVLMISCFNPLPHLRRSSSLDSTTCSL